MSQFWEKCITQNYKIKLIFCLTSNTASILCCHSLECWLSSTHFRFIRRTCRRIFLTTWRASWSGVNSDPLPSDSAHKNVKSCHVHAFLTSIPKQLSFNHREWNQLLCCSWIFFLFGEGGCGGGGGGGYWPIWSKWICKCQLHKFGNDKS